MRTGDEANLHINVMEEKVNLPGTSSGSHIDIGE